MVNVGDQAGRESYEAARLAGSSEAMMIRVALTAAEEFYSKIVINPNVRDYPGAQVELKIEVAARQCFMDDRGVQVITSVRENAKELYDYPKKRAATLIGCMAKENHANSSAANRGDAHDTGRGDWNNDLLAHHSRERRGDTPFFVGTLR